jgi:hypothetical protein
MSRGADDQEIEQWLRQCVAAAAELREQLARVQRGESTEEPDGRLLAGLRWLEREGLL